jgi:hypothetical protein
MAHITYASSTVPEVMDALYDDLVSLTQVGGHGHSTPPLAGVRVNYGPALPDPGRESINILGVEGEQSWASLGKLSKDEVYTITVLVIVIREGQQTKQAVERAYAIAAELEQLLREDVTLGNTCRVAALDSPFDLEVGASDTTRSALLTIGVRVEARI